MTQVVWDARQCLHGETRVDKDGAERCSLCGTFLCTHSPFAEPLVKFYCGCCGVHKPVLIESLQVDALNEPLIWGDIICADCHFVIATISASAPGTYRFALKKE